MWLRIILGIEQRNGHTDYDGDEFPSNVRIVKGESNIGFGAAHNKNLSAAKFDAFAVLNPDVNVDILTLESLKKVVEDDEGIVAAAPILVYPDGSAQLSFRKFPSIRSELARIVGGDRRPDSRWSTLVSVPAGNGIIDVDQPAGAVLVIDTEVLRRIGGFDTTFPMYFEDVDLCTRLCAVGRIVAVTDRRAIHDGEGTAKNYRTATTFWIENSRQRYHRKFSTGLRGRLVVSASYASCLTHMVANASVGLLQGDARRRTFLAKAQGYGFALIAAVAGSDEYWKSRFLGK